MASHFPFVSFRLVVLIATALRIGLIWYSEWHDAHSVIKYTDVDYRVFTDAARFLWNPTGPSVDDPHGNIAQGPLGEWSGLGNPYTRETYRYTPLLAALLTPNIWLHPSFGKYVFAFCDIVVGILIYQILRSSDIPSNVKINPGDIKPEAKTNIKTEMVEAKYTQDSSSLDRKATIYASLHLLNPLVFSISTRGSSESTLAILVVSTLYFALHERWDATAILFGVATHLKLYPIIYATSLLGVVGGTATPAPQLGNSLSQRIRIWLGSVVNRKTIRFAMLSGVTFVLLNVWMYLIWGYPFIYETYLYHLYRRDYKHNFSPYWLLNYLTYPKAIPKYSREEIVVEVLPLWSRIVRSPLTSFVPQMSLALGTGLAFGREKQHLPFAWFVQTALFVAFNKVCTSQYFLWYLTLLPLVLPSLSMSRNRAVIMITTWVGGQAIWLKSAYDLEFLGHDVFYALWIRSILFLLVNVGVLGEIIKAYPTDI